MTKSAKIIVALTAAILIAGACTNGNRGNGDDNYFSAFESFAPEEWAYAHTVSFAVDTLRDSVAHDGILLLSLRHGNGYAWANIWLEMRYRDSDSTRRTDTINVLLADKSGRWRGHGSGPVITVTDTLSRSFTLYRGDTITLRHIMRADTLEAIGQAGIVFIPTH